MPNGSSSIEVLLCTHNRVNLLARTIASLNEAVRPDHRTVSLFVVANACTDDTPSYLADYAARQPAENKLFLRWTEEPRIGKSHALNSAIPRLSSEIVAFVDDDHRVDRQYLVAMERAAARYPEADIFCGKILPDWDGTEPEWVHDSGRYRIYPLPVPRFDLGSEPLHITRDMAIPGGGNLVIRTRLFQRVGNFSTDFGPVGHNLAGAEDTEWIIRAYALGAHLQYCPEIVQYHYVDKARLKLVYLMKKAYERSSATVRFYAREATHKGLFPRYLIRKIVAHFVLALFSLQPARRRFFLVRLAASLGEIKGFLRIRKDGIVPP
jgi:GT2 family glycosyltransferase